MIAKFAGVVGQGRYLRDRASGRGAKLIEYKNLGNLTASGQNR
jgi:hypothetical protein